MLSRFHYLGITMHIMRKGVNEVRHHLLVVKKIRVCLIVGGGGGAIKDFHTSVAIPIHK